MNQLLAAGKINGPSPRARGTRLLNDSLPIFERSIPACAGNTSRDNSTIPRIAVHPRVRGEHACRGSSDSLW